MLSCTQSVTSAESGRRDLNPNTIKAENLSGPYFRIQTRLRRRVISLIVVIFSLFYFGETCLRASEKYFWYDEIYTLYICRLPTLHASWEAVLHGADFNPPLLYALTRISNAIVGEGLIGTRLPEMIGFWVFSLCLFRFVNRRCGPLAGFIAMAFPMLTLAYYYSYEARAHGIVLGFCGLALAFWQMAEEQPGKARWLFAFGLSLAGAFFSHCYAIIVIIPFAITEAYSSLRSRRIRWGPWAAMATPFVISMLALLPLFRSYRAIDAGTSFTRTFSAKWRDTAAFYNAILTPSLLTITAMVVLLLLVFCLVNRADCTPEPKPKQSELILAVTFLALPFFGVALAKFIQGPFVARYFMSAVAGLAILFGFAAGQIRSKWLSGALACVVILSLGSGFASLIVHRSLGRGEFLMEPSSELVLNTAPGRPLFQYRLLDSQQALNPIPIVVPQGLDFLYLVNYDPALRRRLYYVNLPEDTNLREYNLLRRLCHLDYNPGLTPNEFLESYSEFLIYGRLTDVPRLPIYLSRGAEIKSLKFDTSHFLADIKMKSIN